MRPTLKLKKQHILRVLAPRIQEERRRNWTKTSMEVAKTSLVLSTRTLMKMRYKGKKGKERNHRQD